MVEDEESVRGLVRAILQTNGYKVLPATRGEEALSLVQENHDPIELMITDIVMPGMNGRELAALLAPMRPDMKVLFVSGYTDRSVVEHNILDADTPFLQKPFKPEALLRKVRQLLDCNQDNQVLDPVLKS